MKRLIGLLVILLILLTGCGSSEETVESFADSNSAILAELNVPYNYETNQIGADGVNPAIGALSIISVQKHESFNAGGQTLNNVVAIEFFGDFDSVKGFLENKAYLFTENRSDFGSAIYGDAATGKDYMLFYIDSEITDTYAILGGFAKDKNESSKIAFKL